MILIQLIVWFMSFGFLRMLLSELIWTARWALSNTEFFFSSPGPWTVLRILKVTAKAEALLCKMALMFKGKI